MKDNDVTMYLTSVRVVPVLQVVRPMRKVSHDKV